MLTLKTVKVSPKSRSFAAGWTGVVDRLTRNGQYAMVNFKTIPSAVEIAVSQLTEVGVGLEGAVARVPERYRILFGNKTRSNNGFMALCTLVYEEDGVEYGNFVAYGGFAEIPTSEVTEITPFKKANIGLV